MRKTREERKSEIFKAIGQIASQKGFNNVTTKALADILGVTQPAIYKYFKNRDELILYFLNKVNVYLLNIIEAVSKEASIQNRVKRLLSEHLKMVEDNEVLPVMIFSDEIYIGDPKKKERLQTIVFNYRQSIVSLLNECPQSDIAADIILGSIIFSSLKWRLNDKSYSLASKAADLAQVINKLCSWLIFEAN